MDRLLVIFPIELIGVGENADNRHRGTCFVDNRGQFLWAARLIALGDREESVTKFGKGQRPEEFAQLKGRPSGHPVPNLVSEVPLGKIARSHVEHGSDRLIGPNPQHISVSKEELTHRRPRGAFVTIHERMILAQVKCVCRRHLHNRAVKHLAFECHLGLSDRRFEQANIPRTGGSPELENRQRVQQQHLIYRDKSRRCLPTYHVISPKRAESRGRG